jgi:molybdopterin synthase sulfur carrier subunit
MPRGTIRDHVTHQRRPFVRFFACARVLPHALPNATLPDAVAPGGGALFVVGVIAEG